MTVSRISDYPKHNVEVLIIGAGMAGLSAAGELTRAGRHVLLVDKGRGVGGRMATRRIGRTTFDHGAQFITVRDQRFGSAMNTWVDAGVAREWFRPEGPKTGHPRFRGHPGMTAIPKALAAGQDLVLSARVLAVTRTGGAWDVSFEDGSRLMAESVLITAPVPQALAMLDAGEVNVPEDIRKQLSAVAYEPCIAAMAVLDGPSRVPSPGGVAPAKGPIAWITDNSIKGVSAVPALTIHGTGAFSEAAWDLDREHAGEDLLHAAAAFVGSPVTELQVHGWRYSKPVVTVESRYLQVSRSPVLVMAGDAFGGSRVEGAALSGLAAAEFLARGRADAPVVST